MDFGVARLDHSTLTALGTVVGSVRYMSPEQMMGERVDGRADVFSVAAVAYELLTGQAPFPGKTITEVVSRVVHGAHVPPKKADHRLPESLNAVFARAFAPGPRTGTRGPPTSRRTCRRPAQPALDLEVARAPDAAAPVRTEMPAPTATPAPTLPAPRRPGDGWRETVALPEARGAGRLFVEVLPEGSRLEIDGRPVAVPGEGLELSLGPHSLRLSAEGFAEAACAIELTAGHPVVRFSAVLPPGHGARGCPKGFSPSGATWCLPAASRAPCPAAPAEADAGGPRRGRRLRARDGRGRPRGRGVGPRVPPPGAARKRSGAGASGRPNAAACRWRLACASSTSSSPDDSRGRRFFRVNRPP